MTFVVTIGNASYSPLLKFNQFVQMQLTCITPDKYIIVQIRQNYGTIKSV